MAKNNKGMVLVEKSHMTIDIDTLVSHDMSDSVRDFSYILADSAYDAQDIYDYIFENTHTILVKDANKWREIITDRLQVNRKIKRL